MPNMPPMKTPEQAIAERNVRINVRVDWAEGHQFVNTLHGEMKARVRLAGQLLRDKVVVNISRPVRKVRGRSRSGRTRTYVDPTSRSKPGEFPKADTTRLMKSIFARKLHKGYGVMVGTPVIYGLYLELYMNRSFLRRTLKEFSPQLRRVLTKPLVGKSMGTAVAFGVMNPEGEGL